MANEPTQKDHFWQEQNAKSFVKAKSDWLNIGKIHLSFVKHKGKPQCLQDYAIEAALDFDKEDGAHFFAQLVLSGAVKKMADAAREKKKSTNSQYAETVFRLQGGSPAKPEKNRPCFYREVTLAPGDNADYALGAMQCEGEPTDMGGYMPKEGAKRQYIYVGVSSKKLVQLAHKIVAEYSAYRTVSAMRYGFSQWDAAEEPQKEDAPKVQKTDGKQLVAVIYDNLGIVNNAVPMVRSLDTAVDAVQESMKALLAKPEQYKVVKNEDYGAAARMITERKEGVAVINLRSKVKPDDLCGLIVVVSAVL